MNCTVPGCQGSSSPWCKGSEKPSVERQRQEILQLGHALRFLQIGEMNLEVAAEFPQYLTAGAPRRRRRFGVRDNGDFPERTMPLRERFEHPPAVCGDRQP